MVADWALVAFVVANELFWLQWAGDARQKRAVGEAAVPGLLQLFG